MRNLKKKTKTLLSLTGLAVVGLLAYTLAKKTWSPPVLPPIIPLGTVTSYYGGIGILMTPEENYWL